MIVSMAMNEQNYHFTDSQKDCIIPTSYDGNDNLSISRSKATKKQTTWEYIKYQIFFKNKSDQEEKDLCTYYLLQCIYLKKKYIYIYIILHCILYVHVLWYIYILVISICKDVYLFKQSWASRDEVDPQRSTLTQTLVILRVYVN